MRIKNKIVMLVCGVVFALVGASPESAFADSQFSVTPMNQKIVLTPGERYEGTFGIANPVSNTRTFYYKLDIEPFYVDETDNVVFENNGDYNQIVDWVTLENGTGAVEPNGTTTVNFAIDVPSDAPAGGQYAMVRISNNDELVPVSDNLNIQNVLSIAHLIYAEVAGETNRGGEILDADVSGFLLTGNITGTSTVKNTGNVHGDAEQILQVFPLFSDEEIYTNEEDPTKKTVMPERTIYQEMIWGETPAIGIFNVIYTVKFEGVVTQVSKLVIKCPIWLLFIIIFVIAAIIIYIIAKVRKRGAGKKEAA